jgi:hypothetical protein
MTKTNLERLGTAITIILISIGTFWAFKRGGKDFFVYYEAAELILKGQGRSIYTATITDRFLYAPAFAVLFIPFALFSKTMGLFLWSLLKGSLLVYLFHRVSKLVGIFAAVFGILLVARPLLIDFQYGQINVALMAVCAIALMSLFDEKSKNILIYWIALAFLAWTKVLALPLLIVPFMKSNLKNKKQAQKGIFIGLASAILLPVIVFGTGAFQIHMNWYHALQSKGLPLDSHNQSFVAFLFHLFTDEPTHVISQGSIWRPTGISLLSANAAFSMAWIWFLATSGLLLYWIVNVPKQKSIPFQWISIAIAGLIVPSYLIWKPYFVFSFLVGCYAFLVVNKKKNPIPGLVFLFVIFAGINFSGFDFTGPEWGARLESSSILLFMHLLLIAYCLKQKTAA